MNEHIYLTVTAIIIGIVTASYWLLSIKTQKASVSSLMILWGVFILLQLLGLIAAFTYLGHLIIAALFIPSFIKLSAVVQRLDVERQKELLRPLRIGGW